MYKYILFDLDGTLSDPADGIIQSLHYAFDKLGLEQLDEEKCKQFIGPPLVDGFQTICGFSEDEAHEAIRIYREHHIEIGLFENQVYPGIKAMLTLLQENGCQLYVATLKLSTFAETVLKFLGLRSFFIKVVGGKTDGTTPDKADIIADILKEIPPEDLQKTVMVGDRKFDIIGARAHGLDSIGVTYGYGGAEELVAEKPTYIVDSVAELTALLLEG